MATTISGSSNSSFGGTIDSTGIDDNATSTAVTLDTSGNVLVGKTSADGGVAAGHDIRDTGLSYHTVNGGAVTVFNRLTSDGDIAIFRKNGTTVGSIQSRAGVVTTIVLNPASINGAGLSGGTKAVVPADEAGIVDNDISLGVSTHRFKDLYLSGGVYLGGTAAANKLDDYEEGTWTPTFAGGTVTNSYGNYVKVGNVVHVEFGFSNGTITGTLTGDPSVSGLPFTSKANRTSGSVSYLGIFSGSSNVTFLKLGNTTTGTFLQLNAGAGWTANGIGTGSSRYLHVSITYATT